MTLPEDQEGALGEIQKLQFTDQRAANLKLEKLFEKLLPFQLVKAEIVPRAVSLNSISGTLLAEGGASYFFKTHVEPDSILQEYYNATILKEAGYPVIQPIFVEDTPGRQIVVYPFIEHRTVFDILADVEGTDAPLSSLLQAQIASDKQLLAIYSRTSRPDTTDRESPIHQLFYHRLAGRRFDDFYKEAYFNLDGQTLSFREVAACKWVVNGVEYQYSLGESIEQALGLLNPEATWGPNVIGHGDAHNGNLFFDEPKRELLYFDPAFAGRHSPFLDLVKPLFHNVFATWMYYPAEVASKLSLSCELSRGVITVTHDYQPSALRRQMLESKLEHVLGPLLRRADASVDVSLLIARMRSALMCCPLLTVNLADHGKYPAPISLLGLSQCIELASPAIGGRGRFDFLFDGASIEKDGRS